MLNTQDHFVLLNPAQVLSLAIPVNLRSRRLDLISPEEKQKFEELGLNCEEDFSLTLNYDGASVFKSSGRSLWPVLATIDGLPVSEKKRNAIVLGAYFGQKKDEPPPHKLKKGSRIPKARPESFTEVMF